MTPRSDRNIMLKVMEESTNRFDQAELFKLETNQISVNYRSGQLREMSEAQNIGYCLRVFKDGKIAHASTSNVNHLLHLPEKVSTLVRYGEPIEFQFPLASTSSEMPKDVSLTDISVLTDVGKSIIEKIQSYDSSVIVHAGSGYECTKIQIMNANGFDSGYTKMAHSTFAFGSITEERNLLATYSTDLGEKLCSDPESLAEIVIHHLRMGRKNVPFKGEATPVLFSPSAFSDIMAALGAGISGTSVAKGMSPLAGRLNQKIVHESLSIMDDPMFPGAIASQPFDDEGVESKTKYLIRDGILENYLLDLKSAAKLSLPPTGNGFRYTSLIKTRSYAVNPSPSFSNLIIPSGKRLSNEILRSLKRCVYIDQLTGVLLGNLVNGDWGGNIEYGILFENGEPLGRIKNAMTGGNFYQMLSNNYVESSSDRMWVSGFGGSAGSSLFPFILLDGVNISTKD